MDIFGTLDPDPHENLCGSETLVFILLYFYYRGQTCKPVNGLYGGGLIAAVRGQDRAVTVGNRGIFFRGDFFSTSERDLTSVLFELLL